MGQPNIELRRARVRTPSRHSPGLALGRAELAELVAAEVYRRTGREVPLDAHYVAKLERGVIRWPSADYRAALRAVLGEVTDAALGFRPPGATAGPSPEWCLAMAAPTRRQPWARRCAPWRHR